MKKCSVCEKEKNLNEFNKNKSNKSGLTCECIECRKKISRIYYLKNKESISSKTSQHKKDNSKKYAEHRKEWVKRNPEKALFSGIKSRFKKLGVIITLDEYNKLKVKHNEVCAICGGKDKNRMLAIDHCYTTKKIRGLLCGNCNRGLGLLKDDINLLYKAIKYLE